MAAIYVPTLKFSEISQDNLLELVKDLQQVPELSGYDYLPVNKRMRPCHMHDFNLWGIKVTAPGQKKPCVIIQRKGANLWPERGGPDEFKKILALIQNKTHVKPAKPAFAILALTAHLGAVAHLLSIGPLTGSYYIGRTILTYEEVLTLFISVQADAMNFSGNLVILAVAALALMYGGIGLMVYLVNRRPDTSNVKWGAWLALPGLLILSPLSFLSLPLWQYLNQCHANKMAVNLGVNKTGEPDEASDSFVEAERAG